MAESTINHRSIDACGAKRRKTASSSASGSLQLRAELSHKFDEKTGIMLRHRFPLVSLHGFRQAQKFALEMVEGIFAVIQRPPISKRIFGIKQDGIQGAGDSEDPRQTMAPSDSSRSAS